jgi:hypothetical protein
VRFSYCLCLLVAHAVYGQIAPDDAVITVNGFCGHAVAHADTCRTAITRAQFERLTEALDPDMPGDLQLKVAAAYARMMRMAAAAEDRGLDQTPGFAEEMLYARLQLLSRDLDRALRQDAENISDADLEAYFRENRSSFEQATLARIFVPRLKRGESSSEDEMLRVSADLRARAVQGADPDELEREAYTAAGIPGFAPPTKLENVRRATLPPSHEIAMNLAPGEVSEVLSDPGGGHFIYKMVSKSLLSFQEARTDIRKELSEQRYREATQRFSGDVVLNDAYFASHATPHRHQRERRGVQGNSAQ